MNANAIEPTNHRADTYRLRYQELLDFAPDGYVMTDLYGVIREGNHAAAQLFGTRKEFLVGKPLAFFVASDYRSDFYHRLIEVRQQPGADRSWYSCLRPPRGPVLDVEVAVTLLRDGDGLADGLCWLLRDLTPGKRIERALGDEKAFSDLLVDTAQVAILVVDGDGRVARSNPFLTGTSGYAAGELVGHDWCALLIAEPDRRGARELVRRAFQYGTVEGRVYELITRDGARRAVDWSAQRLALGTAAVRVLLTGRDVTDLQEAQRHALRAERLAAIGQTMAGLAHEGRNALQRCQACLERLSWKLQDRPEELDLVARAQKAQDDLLRLFEDVQGYAAPVRLDRGVCDLAEVWQAAWGQLAGPRAGRDAQLHDEVRGLDDLFCYGDPFRLGQVFRNILENALAASADPVHIVIAAGSDVLDGRPAVRVVVRDNGPGLNAEQRQNIFEPFYTTKVKGTGLGMAITRRIVEAHGGRIAVGDGPAPGAEIILTLPRSRP